MQHPEIWIPIAAAFTSAFGAFAGTWFSSRKQTLTAQKQAEVQIASKIADFRQAWINRLRDSLAEFQSYGVTPELIHAKQREFFQAGTQIELLMNRKDPSYEELEGLLYRFLRAKSIDDKFSCNAEFVRVGQEILKREWETLKKDLLVHTR